MGIIAIARNTTADLFTTTRHVNFHLVTMKDHIIMSLLLFYKGVILLATTGDNNGQLNSNCFFFLWHTHYHFRLEFKEWWQNIFSKCVNFGGILVEFWTYSGGILEEFWTHFGRILDEFWTNIGRILGRFWTNFGRILVEFRSIFGRCWVDFGTNFSRILDFAMLCFATKTQENTSPFLPAFRPFYFILCSFLCHEL